MSEAFFNKVEGFRHLNTHTNVLVNVKYLFTRKLKLLNATHDLLSKFHMEKNSLFPLGNCVMCLCSKTVSAL